MTIPSVSVTISDTRSINAGNTSLSSICIIGCASGGTHHTITPISSISQIPSDIGYGVGPSACAYALSNGASTVYFYNCPESSTYVAYNQTLTKTGGGASPTPTLTGSAVDRYDLKIEITKGGAVGTSTFRYSLDGGNKWYGSYVTAATHAIVQPYATGITIAFGAGTYATTDIFTASLYPAAPDVSVASTIASNLIADGRQYRHIHVAGMAVGATDATNIGTSMPAIVNGFITVLDTELSAAYIFAQIYFDSPDPVGTNLHTSTTIAALKTARTTITNNARCHVGAGSFKTTDPLTGHVVYRPASWSYVLDFYVKATDLSVDPGVVGDGPIATSAISLDDQTQGSDSLYDYGYLSLRSFTGKSKGSFYRTGGVTCTESQSDLYYLPVSLGLDIVAEVSHRRVIDLINSKVQCKGDGTISELSAKSIESAILSTIRSVVVSAGHIDDAYVTVDRSNNLKATGALKVLITVKTFGYIRSIALTIKVAGVL